MECGMCLIDDGPVRTVLLVDDDELFELLMPRLFKQAQLSIRLHCVRDGEQAIDYLKGRREFTDRSKYPLPDLILLDLKMPKVDGFEVMEWKNRHPELSRLPVIVWSSSELPRDKERAYALGALQYLLKPGSMEDFADIAHDLAAFLETSHLPVAS